MTKSKHGVFAIVLGVLVSLLAVTSPSSTAAPAAAAPKISKYFYYGHAGGSQVQVLGNVVRQDLTGASSVQGYQLPNNDTNRVAGLNVGAGLVKIGAINTWAKAQKAARGTRITTGGRTADISLLGGVIAVNAVETSNTAVKRPGFMTSSTKTRFLGLTIAGKTYPVNIARNTSINIPGIANVILNASWEERHGQTTYSYGYGLAVQLLKPFKNVPAAAVVYLNPTYSAVAPAPPPGAPSLSGVGFGTNIKADVSKDLGVEAGPTGAVFLPPGGTHGEPMQNSTAGINLPGILNVGVVRSLATGRTLPGIGDARVMNQIGGINVLNGAITADAIKTQVIVRKRPKKALKRYFTTQLVGLKILGQPIDVNVSPNTVLNVADLGRVTINMQRRTKSGAIAMGVQVRLSTERAGLPIGAVVEIGVVSADIHF